MASITAEQIDFSSDKSTAVISAAQKFIIPVPAFHDGGEPLVYPEGDKVGKPITDWKGNPIGEKGLVFFNGKDNAYQAVKGDGNGVVIINLVTEDQAKKISSKIAEFNSDPARLSLAQIKEVLRYVREELGLIDMYNSDKNFIAEKMSSVGVGSGIAAYGLHKRDDRDICHAVYVPGSGEFQGPAATPQKFSDGAVILKQGDNVRLIQPDVFEASYKHTDGSPVKVSELAQQAVEQTSKRSDGKLWTDASSERGGRVLE